MKITLSGFARFLVAWILLLILFGGHVKSTNSGLSVPDWPNTYGHFMFSFPWDQMVGGIFWEHSHRMIASLAGIFTFVLTWWVLRTDQRKWVRQVAIWSSVVVLVQGVLGGMTVWFNLPVWISSSHGTLAQIYLCLVLTIAAATGARWNQNPTNRSDSPGVGLRSLVLATTLTIFCQLILGAVMRHSEAGLVIPDFPTMFGSWVPPLTSDRLAFANQELWRMNLMYKIGLQEVTMGQIVIHLLHRLGAVAVTVMIVWTFVKVRREQAQNRMFVRPAEGLLWLLMIQVTLGILTILTEKQPEVTTLHVVTGAITLAVSFLLTLHVRHQLVPPSKQPTTMTVQAKEGQAKEGQAKEGVAA
ncbi:MAG: COX15/CtaA family protein [Chlorobi bacterium]|nr:COX15/CtaA family protein [Chlorobiota bacterium]